MLLSYVLSPIIKAQQARKSSMDALPQTPHPLSSRNHYPQLETEQPRKTDTCAASVQGARPAQEDRFNIRPPLFAVHDGHGGAAAVDKLTSIFDRAAIPRHGRDLVELYKAADDKLKDDVTGAVSVALLVSPGRLHMAWVGDCVGVVFHSRTGRVVRCDKIEHFDSCADAPAQLAHAVRHGEDNTLRTRPHALTPDIAGWATRTDSSDGVVGRPTGFIDPFVHREYVLACAAAGEIEVQLKERMPFVSKSCDVRILGSVQPTRSLGDAPHRRVLVRGVQLVEAPIPDACFALICSDGFFDGGAFSAVDSVCRFLAQPLHFIRESFYGPWQELTHKLMVSEHLPHTLNEGWRRHYGLFACWRDIRTWADIPLLLSMHQKAVERLRPPPSWLSACRHSAQWLAAEARTGAFDVRNAPERAAKAAAHMAVVMGSHDNCTALVVNLRPA